jgi:predicted O-methyltransferase YrrM
VISVHGHNDLGLAVEIGSFAGKSTVCIADAVDHLVSIDPHHGNPEMQKGRECFVAEAWDEADGVVDSLPLLRRTLRRAGLEHKVTCIAALSTEVAAWWSAPIGFLFIDGDHGPGVADDYRDWSPHLTDDAVLALHDTAIPAVAEVCAQALRDGWQLVDNIGNCLRVFTR